MVDLLFSWIVDHHAMLASLLELTCGSCCSTQSSYCLVHCACMHACLVI